MNKLTVKDLRDFLANLNDDVEIVITPFGDVDNIEGVDIEAICDNIPSLEVVFKG